jgi:hypothetical protein
MYAGTRTGFGAFAAMLTVAGAAWGGPPRAETGAPGQPTASVASDFTRLQPDFIQGVRLVNGQIVPTTPVRPYRDGAATRTEPVYAWDAYQSASGAPGVAPSGGRYLLSWTTTPAPLYDYHYGRFVNQMVLPAEFNGQMATTLDYLFRNNVAGQLIIAVFTGEDYNTSCADAATPPLGNAYDGVQLTYANPGIGFFYTNVDLGTNGLSLQLPMDGTGGFVAFLNSDTQGTPAAQAQFGLWGTGDHQTPPTPRAGTEDASGYVDNSTPPTPATNLATNIPNGTLEQTNGECSSWARTTNPTPLCPAFGFGLKMTSSCQADINGDGQVNVNDFLGFLTLFADADARADINGDNVVNVSDFLAYLSLFAAGC